MAADPLRSKALSILREGRCSIVRATCDETYAPQRVMAIVTSSRENGGHYVVELHLDRAWSCTCSSVFATGVCPHRAAVQMVTVGEIQGLSAPGVKADLPAKAAHDGGPHSHLGGPASGALSEQAS